MLDSLSRISVMRSSRTLLTGAAAYLTGLPIML